MCMSAQIYILMSGPQCCAVVEGSSVRMMMLLVFVGALWVVLGVFVCSMCVYMVMCICIYMCSSLCELCARGLLRIGLQPHYWLDLGYGAAAASPLSVRSSRIYSPEFRLNMAVPG